MAHLSCVGETREGLTEILDRFEDAGIENVLALRGDPPRGEADFQAPDGGLSSAAELAGFISERYDFAIGGACFPEVHPEAPSPEADLAYLKTKVEAGAQFLITQLFFDNRVYFNFVAAARDAGIEVPIIPGVIPIASYAQVSRICDLCDASIPPELSAAMEASAATRRPRRCWESPTPRSSARSSWRAVAPGIHFYALNRAPGTRAVLARCAPRVRGSGRGGAASAPVSVE